MFASSYS